MSNGQAPKGGIVGVNGEFYEGGKFLPSTARAKGEPKPVKKFTGPRKEQVTRYEYAERPEGMRSIYSAIVGSEAKEINGVMSRYEEINPAYARSEVYGCSIDLLIERWNDGDRWVVVANA